MKPIKVVAFDCDGVLLDTEQANRAYYNHLLKHFDRPAMSEGQFSYIHMHTLDESLAFLFPDPDSLKAAQSYRQGMDYKPYLSLLSVEPHLLALLKKIRPNLQTAIATNRTDTLKRVLDEFQLDGYFDLIVTASDVKRPKPHPDALLKILEYFSIQPQQAIYVGDSQLDELAAKAAGIPLVAYRNKALSSDYHIQNLQELEFLLEI